MSVPFLAMAQFGGRLDARFRTGSVVVAGTVVAAVGVLLLSRAGTVPVAVCASGYVLYGAGFGTFVPATTHAAMRDVPAGSSGAASSVLNTSRQIGSSVCLAVFGTVEVNAEAGSFLRGYQVAVGLAAGCTVAAAGLAFAGFRDHGSPAGRVDAGSPRTSPALSDPEAASAGEIRAQWERVVGRGR